MIHKAETILIEDSTHEAANVCTISRLHEPNLLRSSPSHTADRACFVRVTGIDKHACILSYKWCFIMLCCCESNASESNASG